MTGAVVGLMTDTKGEEATAAREGLTGLEGMGLTAVRVTVVDVDRVGVDSGRSG